MVNKRDPEAKKLPEQKSEGEKEKVKSYGRESVLRRAKDQSWHVKHSGVCGVTSLVQTCR